MSDNNHNGRTFKTAVSDDGTVQAGGMRLFQVDPYTGRFVFDDRWERRCQARGTKDVPVEAIDLLEEVLAYLRAGGQL